MLPHRYSGPSSPCGDGSAEASSAASPPARLVARCSQRDHHATVPLDATGRWSRRRSDDRRSPREAWRGAFEAAPRSGRREHLHAVRDAALQELEQLSGDRPLHAAADVAGALALDAAGGVGARLRIVAQPGDRDGVQRAAELPVPTPVDSLSRVARSSARNSDVERLVPGPDARHAASWGHSREAMPDWFIASPHHETPNRNARPPRRAAAPRLGTTGPTAGHATAAPCGRPDLRG